MGFWSKKKRESLTDGRKLKDADLSGFVSPIFVTEREIKPSDEKLIQQLKNSFEEAGVINDEPEIVEEDPQSIEEVIEIIQEANANALNEKDFHETKKFDEKLHDELDNYEHDFKGGDNFLLDGMDDYGNQIYESGDGYNPVWD